MSRRCLFAFSCWILARTICSAASPEGLFQNGAEAYRAADYPQASAAFREAAALHPAAGTLYNLGNAEWQRGRSGLAILAWEQSIWLNPFNKLAHNNLRFARKTHQLENPDLTWYKVVSTWLPVNWWAWLAGLTFWAVIALVMLPGIFRLRKATWHQALAALCLTLFLLSLPAHYGALTRSRLGFIVRKESPLLLTPTAQSQIITRLAAGEPARVQRVRGNYLLVRTSRGRGWLERERFGLVCGKPASAG